MPDRPSNQGLRIGLIGHGFMGRVHALAWRTAEQLYPLPVGPVLAGLAGRDPERAADAAGQLGFSMAVADWRQLVDRPDIDVIDICTPVGSHAEIASRALAAGKHVLCEKPLARTTEEARQLALSAARARQDGLVAAVGYNYRRLPAIELARQFVAEGRIGEIRHIRARYLQDWLARSDHPWSWRLDAAQAGSGALGDIGSHLIDLMAHVAGLRLYAVTGSLATFVASRSPGPPDGAARRPVTVDDASTFLGRAQNGVLAVFEASRTALGRKNQLSFELNGSEGTIVFDLERLNELGWYSGSDDGSARGFRTILVTEETHPYLKAWWPPGHTLGWDHAFVHQARDFLSAVATGQPYVPGFADGLYVQEVVDAVMLSARTGAWQPVASAGDDAGLVTGAASRPGAPGVSGPDGGHRNGES